MNIKTVRRYNCVRKGWRLDHQASTADTLSSFCLRHRVWTGSAVHSASCGLVPGALSTGVKWQKCVGLDCHRMLTEWVSGTIPTFSTGRVTNWRSCTRYLFSRRKMNLWQEVVNTLISFFSSIDLLSSFFLFAFFSLPSLMLFVFSISSLISLFLQ
jgi:hypothetical protein